MSVKRTIAKMLGTSEIRNELQSLSKDIENVDRKLSELSQQIEGREESSEGGKHVVTDEEVSPESPSIRGSTVTAERLADTLIELCDNSEPDQFFTVREIVDKMGAEQASPTYRGFVASSNTIHGDPGRFLNGTEYVDVVRRKLLGSGFDKWEFTLVTAEQIKDDFERSGFEDATKSHQHNAETLGLWDTY